MTRDETDLQQSDVMDLPVEVSNEALEAACGGLMQDLQLLLLDLTASPVALICIANGSRRADQATAKRWRWI
jgi:hypothetical protein